MISLKNNYYSVYDLIQDFGGFLQDASLDGVKIVRENKLDDILNIEEELNELEEQEEDSSKLLGISNKDFSAISFIDRSPYQNHCLAYSSPCPIDH